MADNNEMRLVIPLKTIFVLLTTALAVYLLLLVSPLLMLLFLGLMVAVTLYPMQRFLMKIGLPSWAAILIITFLLIIVVGATVLLIVPPLIDQVSDITKKLPDIENVFAHLGIASGRIHQALEHMLNGANAVDPSVLSHVLFGVTFALGGLSEVALILIFSIYFLADGPRTLVWILAFFSEENRAKLKQTTHEMSGVISAYVAGQFITSILCSIFAYLVLALMKVPAALVLAVIAGIFDVLPILGFFMFTIPAVVLALTVSTGTGAIVGALFMAYHAIENYLIVPKIYGNRLQVSGLAVLLALLVGGVVAHILGAIAVLPIVASYPIIERIWLVEWLGTKVVNKHRTQD